MQSFFRLRVGEVSVIENESSYLVWQYIDSLDARSWLGCCIAEAGHWESELSQGIMRHKNSLIGHGGETSQTWRF